MRLDPMAVRRQIEQLRLQAPELWEEEDEKLLLDMLEGETELHEFLRVVEDQRQEDACTAGAIATRIAELELRQQRFVTREKGRRAMILALMTAAGVQKVPLPEATLSISKGRESLFISDEAAVPDEYCEFKRHVSKTKIKEALLAGVAMNFAAMVTGDPSLSIRTK